MKEKRLYIPEEDMYFSNPYIDVEEWRDKPVRHYYIHGGFKGTEIDGTNEARFCFYFPEKLKYEERFYQYVSAAPEDERMCENQTGADDKINFIVSHGAYYVVTNQGGFVTGGDGSRLYRTSASSALLGRKLAQKLYGYEHRPYGYIFGGSGGSFKTISCMEMTEGVWDGGVPYVIANPMATPNVFCPRVRAMHVLGESGMAKVIDNMEPGGSGNLYDGLTAQQTEALEEATRMGFPKRGWFCSSFMGDGSLMVLSPAIYNVYPQYFTDFWTKEGYEGTNPDSIEVRERVRFVTTVKELIEVKKEDDSNRVSSVDTSWKYSLKGNLEAPRIRMELLPPENAYLIHCRLRVLSGVEVGKEQVIEKIEDGVITIGRTNGEENELSDLAVGDKIMIDNSDYLAMQTLQRHQVPDKTYKVYDQYRNDNGTLKYPQLPILIAPIIAQNGGGSVPSGDIHGKIIALCSILDESALAWHGDWYFNAVKRHLGDKTDESFRLYYNDNCIHNDLVGYQEDPQHQVDYACILFQVLLDLADWCERGIAPVPSTNYIFNDGQIEVPDSADERGGLQPVVHAWANGVKCVKVKVGEEVVFTAKIEVPRGTGKVTAASWDYEKTNDFSHEEELELSKNGEKAWVRTVHCFNQPGVFFPVIKVKSNREGRLGDIFTQCKNLDRVRVIVE